jgi:hypothetical protein
MVTPLRESVIQRWIDAGAPAWSEHETLEQTEFADRVLERLNQNPASRFRENRLAKNLPYMY